MLKHNNRVRYTERHFEWLCSANLWRRGSSRKAVVGVVVSDNGAGVTMVQWSGDKHPKRHFTDNIELVS